MALIWVFGERERESVTVNETYDFFWSVVKAEAISNSTTRTREEDIDKFAKTLSKPQVEKFLTDFIDEVHRQLYSAETEVYEFTELQFLQLPVSTDQLELRIERHLK